MQFSARFVIHEVSIILVKVHVQFSFQFIPQLKGTNMNDKHFDKFVKEFF